VGGALWGGGRGEERGGVREGRQAIQVNCWFCCSFCCCSVTSVCVAVPCLSLCLSVLRCPRRPCGCVRPLVLLHQRPHPASCCILPLCNALQRQQHSQSAGPVWPRQQAPPHAPLPQARQATQKATLLLQLPPAAAHLQQAGSARRAGAATAATAATAAPCQALQQQHPLCHTAQPATAAACQHCCGPWGQGLQHCTHSCPHLPHVALASSASIHSGQGAPREGEDWHGRRRRRRGGRAGPCCCLCCRGCTV
jgi:hypothetical protein